MLGARTEKLRGHAQTRARTAQKQAPTRQNNTKRAPTRTSAMRANAHVPRPTQTHAK